MSDETPQQAANDTPMCPVCDTPIAIKEGAVQVRCPKCGTLSHVSDLTGERRAFLKGERVKQVEAALQKAVSGL